MQKHIKVYRKFYGIGDQDQQPTCALCPEQANDIHHIHSRGLKAFMYNGCSYGINEILNLIALCRKHHEDAHGGEYTKDYLLAKNEILILRWYKQT